MFGELTILQRASIVLMGVVLFAWIIYFLAAPVWDAVRRWYGLPTIQRIFMAAFVFGFVAYGGSKIRFSDGIRDAGGSYVTNDTVHIEWERDTSHVIVPMNATVYIDYRPIGSTNEWGTLGQSVVSAGMWEGTVAGATNYDYLAWAYYIPPEPVHTNGVWVYKTMKDRREKYAIPLHARVEVDGKAIATPLQKRKEEDDE